MHQHPQKTEWIGFFFGEMAVPYLQGADTGAMRPALVFG
jgi:hypothetical protein